MNEEHKREARILKDIMSPTFYNAMTTSKGYLAGGAIRGVFCSEPIVDFDIFFRSRINFDNFVSSFDKGESPTFTTTDTAWTHIDEDKVTYQLICAEFGEPSEVIKKFDFSCCMGAWEPEKGFILDKQFLKHCSQHRLVFNANAGFPICSMWRAIKFIKRGWKLPAIESIKLALSINHLNLTNHAELKRQLLGIDTLFLKELTDALEKDKAVAYDFGEAIEMLMAFVDKED